ncbi:MAG: 5-formyltetrahydrofolate cyclo-ligase [Thermodesulfobacteriota bacterium]|nr:5-formyltetrahydrofolate cyclo-ligase [Thermodesulfobacteriota bacterium]
MKESLLLYQSSLDKFALREYIRAERSKLQSSTIGLQSERISSFLVDDPLFKSAKFRNIVLYSSIKGEVDTSLIDTEARKLNKNIFYPKLINRKMVFAKANSIDDFLPGCFGIKEPISNEYIDIANVDLFIIPAVAIDVLGFRLGFGKGFYDKELQNISRDKIYSLVFDFQLIKREFGEEHDIRVKKVFTEKEIVTIN